MGFRLPVAARHRPGTCPFCALRFFIREGRGDRIVEGGSGKNARAACDGCASHAWMRRSPGTAPCPACGRGTLRFAASAQAGAAPGVGRGEAGAPSGEDEFESHGSSEERHVFADEPNAIAETVAAVFAELPRERGHTPAPERHTPAGQHRAEGTRPPDAHAQPHPHAHPSPRRRRAGWHAGLALGLLVGVALGFLAGWAAKGGASAPAAPAREVASVSASAGGSPYPGANQARSAAPGVDDATDDGDTPAARALRNAGALPPYGRGAVARATPGATRGAAGGGSPSEGRAASAEELEDRRRAIEEATLGPAARPATPPAPPPAKAPATPPSGPGRSAAPSAPPSPREPPRPVPAEEPSAGEGGGDSSDGSEPEARPLEPPPANEPVVTAADLDRLLRSFGAAGSPARAAAAAKARDAILALDAAAARSLDASRALARTLEKHLRLLASEPATADLASAALAGHAERLARAASGPATLREARAQAERSSRKDLVAALDERIRALRPHAGEAAQTARRERERDRRARAREEATGFLARRFEEALPDIEAAVAALEAPGAATTPSRDALLSAARALTPAGDPRGERFLGRIEALAVGAGAAANAAAAKALDESLKRLRERNAPPFLKAVDACLGAGEPGIGFDMLRVLLALEPSNRRAHTGLGHVRTGDEWLRPYDASQRAQGLAWTADRGWVAVAARERYDAGEHFDLAERRWGKLADLDRAHADPARPRTLESEHFVVRSTASLALTARLTERLEAFFLQVFRQYDLVFAAKGDDSGARLIFGVAPSARRLEVRFYRDEAQFRAHAEPPTTWCAGFYSPAKGASYFYGRGETFDATMLQHEVTHQILGEIGGKGDAPSWLVEGAAVVIEDASFDDAGTLVLGDIETRGDVRAYRDSLRAGGDEHKLRACLAFRPGGTPWDSGDIHKNYRGVGALLYFLMTFDEGRYRGDAVEMIRDGYRGTLQPLGAYFGLTDESLEGLMDAYYRGG